MGNFVTIVKKGHFSKCYIKTRKQINQIEQENETESDESETYDNFFIGAIKNEDMISFDENNDQEWTIDLTVNKTLINFKIDSGTEANIIPLCEYRNIRNRPKLHKPRVKLTAYNGTNIPVEGSCILYVENNNKCYPILFIVADIDSQPIIALKTSKQLNLIQRIMKIEKEEIPNYINKYDDCFGNIGCLGEKYHIEVDETIPPVVNPPRRIPVALRERVEKELDRMEKTEIIKRVDEPTDWVNSMVVVEKHNGNLRVCLDPKHLNKAIKRPHYAMPTTEEILTKISTGKFFTKLDASNAYWQIPVDESSSKLLTFNSPKGRYRFLRIPYGIHSASDICQQRIALIIEDTEGVANSQDDIIIWGETLDELKQRTINVFQSIRKHGLKLNKSKCQFNKSEIIFLGHKITSEGIFPDEKKTEAIKNMPYLTNVKELQRFLGMVNYLAIFIPNLTSHTVNLRKLLEKDTKWYFDKIHIKEVDTLKSLIIKPPILKFYNPNLPIKISCDASQKGLGAALEQQHENISHPIGYASRTLTPAEQNYCQLEKEILSIVFACQKFHNLIYGKKFYVFNDHLPLKSIFNKSILKAPPRIQRFLLRLQRYDFEMHYIQESY